MTFDRIDRRFGQVPKSEPANTIEREFVEMMRRETVPFRLKNDDVCEGCSGGGWECYGLGFGDPHFRECTVCGNPEGLPCP